MGRFCLILGSDVGGDVGRKRSSPFSDKIGLILSVFEEAGLRALGLLFPESDKDGLILSDFGVGAGTVKTKRSQQTRRNGHIILRCK